jgi:hypothetical protein
MAIKQGEKDEKERAEKKIHKSILLIFYDTSFRELYICWCWVYCWGFLCSRAIIANRAHDQATINNSIPPHLKGGGAGDSLRVTRDKYLFPFSFQHQINCRHAKFIRLNLRGDSEVNDRMCVCWTTAERKAMKLILIKVRKHEALSPLLIRLHDKQKQASTHSRKGSNE